MAKVRATNASGGGGAINYNMQTIAQGSSTDSSWYTTTIPSDKAISIYVKATSYSYYGYFAVVNGALSWVNGTHTTYDYFAVDTSGEYVKIGQRFGGSSTTFDYVATVSE